MRIGLRESALALALWLAACTAHQPPVPVVGPASDIAALVGEWSGEYSSDETGRSGSISFVLAARGDTAHGDVIMIPRGFNQPLRAVPNQAPSAAERPRAEALTISFVRVSGNEVSGVLAPYRDPECGCVLATRFIGWLRADTIAGAYFSHHERSETEAQGRWKVVRKPRGPSDGR